jgi:hypothetical protein
VSSTDEPPALAAEEEKFYSSAILRIRTFMLVLAPLFCAVAWLKFGWRSAAGFLLGCIIAYLNFQWLKSGVSVLADKVTNTGKRQSGRATVARFLLRYALLGLAAYAILTSFPGSLRGLFSGLFLPVAAILCEAVYELYVATVRHV